MALKRVANEFRHAFLESPTEFAVSCPDGNIFHWRALIAGPSQSHYAGGVFEVSLHFPSDYPFASPEMQILTPMWHPHVHRDTGRVCNCCFGRGILSHLWSPAFSAVKLIRTLMTELADPVPFGDCGMNWHAAPEEIGTMARSFTELYAMNGVLRSAARLGVLWVAPEWSCRGRSVASIRHLDPRTVACLQAEVTDVIAARRRVHHSALCTIASDAVDGALRCIVPYGSRGDVWALKDMWRLVSPESHRRFYTVALSLRRLGMPVGLSRLVGLLCLEHVLEDDVTGFDNTNCHLFGLQL